MGIKVLSLFDGMSCGRIALEKLGVKVDRYVASEVDKHAIKVSRSNYPDIVQMGSVTELEYENGQVFNWMDSTELGKVDLFIGGSPCQNFSFSGSRKGMATKDNVEILSLGHYLQLKEDGFEFQGQSYLFWEYVRLLREVQKENPDVLFLLENVKMAKKWQDLISGVLGVEPIVINSALVSAQNRVRLYWTNIQGITQPEDRDILLKDIIDYSVPFDRTFTPKNGAKFSADGLMVVGNADGINGHDIIKRVYSVEGKSPTVTAVKGGNQEVKIAKPINLGNVNPSGRGQNGNVYLVDGLSPCLTTNKGVGEEIATFVDREKSYCIDANYWKGGNPTQYFEKSRRQLVFAEVHPASIVGRRINEKGVRDDYNIDVPIIQTLEVQPSVKSRCLTTVEKDCLLSLEEPGRYPDAYNRPELLWRKLTPVECERLQTVPDKEIICIFTLCLDQVKNYVSAVERSPKLLKLALNAEKTELNEFAKLVTQDILQSNQQIKHIALRNADMQIQRQIKQYTQVNPVEINTIAGDVENVAMCQSQNQEGDFALVDAFINITEGRITHFGKAELHLKGNHSTTQLNGGRPLKLFGNEIMEFVKDVGVETQKINDTSSIYTTLLALGINNIEQMLATFYLFAKNATTGYTHDTTSKKNLSVQFKINDGYTSCVSNSQRYKMLGNGWTVDVIAHILSFAKWQ